MANKTSVNIGARLDRLPQSKWHVKIWLVTAFALLVCWSNGIGLTNKKELFKTYQIVTVIP